MGVTHKDRRWYHVRLAAKRRDDFRCTKCGARGRIEVHHVIPASKAPDLAFDVSNVTTLCVTCHLHVTRRLPTAERSAWNNLLKKGISSNA